MNLPTQFSSLSLVMYKEQWTAPENHTNSKSVVYRTSKNTKKYIYKLQVTLWIAALLKDTVYIVCSVALSSVFCWFLRNNWVRYFLSI